jgi:hypothetical protein
VQPTHQDLVLHLITSQVQAEAEPLWAESDAAKLAIYLLAVHLAIYLPAVHLAIYLPAVHPMLMSHPPPGSIQAVIYSKLSQQGSNNNASLLPWQPYSGGCYPGQARCPKPTPPNNRQTTRAIPDGNTNTKNNQKFNIHGRERHCKQQQQPYVPVTRIVPLGATGRQKTAGVGSQLNDMLLCSGLLLSAFQINLPP